MQAELKRDRVGWAMSRKNGDGEPDGLEIQEIRRKSMSPQRGGGARRIKEDGSIERVMLDSSLQGIE